MVRGSVARGYLVPDAVCLSEEDCDFVRGLFEDVPQVNDWKPRLLHLQVLLSDVGVGRTLEQYMLFIFHYVLAKW